MTLNRGAEILKSSGVPMSEVAFMTGLASKTMPHRWTTGERIPTPEQRAALARIVPPSAWDEPATGEKTADRVLPPRPPKDAGEPSAESLAPNASTREMAENQVARLRTLLQRAITKQERPAVIVQIERELRQAISALADLRGDLSHSDMERLVNSDEFKGAIRAIIDALAALPATGLTRVQVATALQEAFVKIDEQYARRGAQNDNARRVAGA